MNDKNKKLLKQVNIWIYLIPFLLITFFFSVRSYYSIEQKIADSYDHFIEDAADAARNYSYTLKKAAEAEKIINGHPKKISQGAEFFAVWFFSERFIPRNG